MSELSWRHHAPIQALLSRGPLVHDDFHAIFSGITGSNPGAHQQKFNDYLLKINKELSYVHFELGGCRNQYDGKVYYGVVNNVSDEQSKLGTKYTVPQLAFYNQLHKMPQLRVIYLMLMLPIFDLRVRYLLEWHHNHRVFHQLSLLHLIISQYPIEQDQWLSSTPDGKIRLGVRSFLNLRNWFHNNNVPSCDICNEAGLKAEPCRNEGCTVRIHLYCLKREFSQRGVERVCPGCGTQWQSSSTIGTVEEEGEPNRPSQRHAPPLTAATRKRLRNKKWRGWWSEFFSN